MIIKLLKNIDELCSKFFNIKYPLVIKKNESNDSNEFFYKKEHWNKLMKEYWRRDQEKDGHDQIWIKNFLLDGDKLAAIRYFNAEGIFSKYKKILDLGAGPLYVTFLLSVLNNDKEFIAADYSEEIISIAKSTKILSEIPYYQIDVLNEGVEFPSADLTIVVNFEYHFDDIQLNNIFKKINKNLSDIFVVTHTIATPTRLIKSLIRNRNVKKLNGAAPMRFHGYERSEKLLKKIAISAGYQFLEKHKSGYYKGYLFKRINQNNG